MLMTIPEVAAVCRVTSGTVRRWFQEGVLPEPLRMGGRLRWHRDTIEAWLAAGCPHQEQTEQHEGAFAHE